MKRRQAIGGRYLAVLTMAFAILFFVAGTVGPAHHSPFYWWIVPPPALAALTLGWCAWSSDGGRAAAFAGAGLALLLIVLIFSHLLPRSVG